MIDYSISTYEMIMVHFSHTHRIELSDHSYPNIDDIWIVGVSNIKEEPVIFTTREPASLLLTSLQNVLVRNIRFHHKLDSPIQTYRSAICNCYSISLFIHNGLLYHLCSCERSFNTGGLRDYQQFSSCIWVTNFSFYTLLQRVTC